MNRIIVLIATVATALALGSCRSNKPVAPSYYLIEMPAGVPQPDSLAPLPYNLELADVDIHPAYSTLQIALRENPGEVSYYVNHFWAARPHESMQRFMAVYFTRYPVFAQTQQRFWNLQPDYKLFVSVYNIEVVKGDKDYFARVHMELRLENNEGVVVERYLTDNSRLLEKRNLGLFTQAVNNIFFEELHYFAQKVRFMLNPS